MESLSAVLKYELLERLLQFRIAELNTLDIT